MVDKRVEEVINRVVKKYPVLYREDLVQECWLAAIPKMKSFDPSKGKLSRFLHNKLNRTCKTFINQEKQMSHETIKKAFLVIDPLTL